MSKIFSIFAVRKIGMLAMNRFREWCNSIWQRVCAAARPLRLWLGRVREWAAVVRVWLEPVRQWWLRLSEKYAAQQEVIKRQSEVSHDEYNQVITTSSLSDLLSENAVSATGLTLSALNTAPLTPAPKVENV